MDVKELFVEILNNYSKEYISAKQDGAYVVNGAILNSCPYFSGLRKNTIDIFRPLISGFGKRIKIYSSFHNRIGQRAYISFPADKHCTSKGIYPIYHFTKPGHGKIRFSIGISVTQQPLKEMYRVISGEFLAAAKGYDQYQDHLCPLPCKYYDQAELDSNILIQDFNELVRIYLSTLEKLGGRLNLDEFTKKGSISRFWDSGEDLQADLEEIIKNGSISQTEKDTLIKARIGQGKFRKILLSRWKGCAVTDIKDHRLLLAGHIKAWNESSNKEKLDVNNGLLLMPVLDKLFDKHLISFDKQGKILINSKLSRDDLAKLGISEGLKIKKIYPGMETYLEKHRTKFFKNHGN